MSFLSDVLNAKDFLATNKYSDDASRVKITKVLSCCVSVRSVVRNG